MRFLVSTDPRDFSKVCAMKTPVPTILIIFSLSCSAFLSQSQALSPPPDGGYAGGNTAEGQNALLSLSTGTYNTALGLYSLLSNSTGKFNTGVGAATLLANTADQNTATGTGGLLSNTTGTENTATGAFSLFFNTEGNANVANGASALLNNTIGSANTADGASALFFNTEGSANTANGSFSLQNNTTGNNNTAIGYGSLLANTVGSDNTAIGYHAAWNTATGDNNTAVGRNALAANGGSQNTAIGVQALENNISGNNTAVGYLAGTNNTSGTQNIALGAFAGVGVTTADNVICIGVNGDNVSDSCYIGNIFGGTVSAGATVIVDNNGHLGTIVSSQRFKEQIKPMDKASEAIFALKPVTFRYRQHIDFKGIPQFGLVAEEVEKVNPDLVVRDKEGKPYSVRYEQVNAMLLNEFLKEHKTVQEQQKEIDALKVELREQRDLIQKVSAQVEMHQPMLQVAAENP
jgi:trimeric autotransporter adhesin